MIILITKIFTYKIQISLLTTVYLNPIMLNTYNLQLLGQKKNYFFECCFTLYNKEIPVILNSNLV